jgi:hypothetical protein
MWDRLGEVWLPRLLFLSTLLVAALAVAVVLTAPFVSAAMAEPPYLLQLFAEDATVRRTGLASAAGLVVTAFVFFRPGGVLRKKKGSSRRPPSGTMAGA